MTGTNHGTPDMDTNALPQRQYASIAIAILVCLGLTFTAFHQVRTWERDVLEAEFKRGVNNHVAVLQQTIDGSITLIESLSGLYAASQYVDQSEFRQFVQPFLQRHPEIQAFEWIPRVKHSDRAAFETFVRESGLPDFQLTELHETEGIVAASHRTEYFPVHYLEPVGSNGQSLGFDLASETTRREALEHARDSGRPTTTRWISLIQELADQHGILVVKPIYANGRPQENVEQRRDSLVGYVLGVFRVGHMIEESLQDVGAAGLDFWVYESAEGERATTSYYHPSRSRTDEDEALDAHATNGHTDLHQHAVLNLPERQWSLLFKPAPVFYAAHGRHYATGTLIVGLLLTTLLGIYLTSMVRRSLRAGLFTARLTKLNTDLKQEVVDRRQAEQALAASEHKYRSLVETAPEAITVLDTHGDRLIEANQGAERLFGMARKTLLNVGPVDLSPATQPDGRRSDEAARDYIQQAVDGKKPIFEWMHQDASGKMIPCEVRLIRLPDPERILVRGTINDISARKQAEGVQERLGRILDNASNEIYVFDAETLHFVQVNRGARENLGYSMQELTALTPVDIKPYFNEQQFQAMLAPLRTGAQKLLTVTTEYERKDGTRYPVEILLHLSRQEDPQVFVAIVQDITERIKTEQALRESEHYNRMLFEESTIGLALCRMDGDLVDLNPAFASILGRTVKETLQMSYWEITPEKYAESEKQQLQILETTGRYGPYEKEYIHKDGHLVPVRLTGRILEKKGQKFIWSSVEDITDRKQARARIDHLAFHDGLTDLPNRELLRDRLEHAISMARRDGNGIGILFLDIDRFKAINDSLGHSIGDQLLQQAAYRLGVTVRESDTVARFGGDEFVVIAEHITDREQIEILSRKIIMSMEEPFYVDARELFVTASVGIALYPENSTEFEVLITQADIAMYHAKASGRNNYQFYTEDMAARVVQRTSLESDLRGALEREELLFHCQPIIDLTSGHPTSMEVLMRWQHPQRGLVSPAEFIPVMEDMGMIVPITRWILKQACKQSAAVREQAQIDIAVAVNFSAPCFHDAEIVEYVQQTLEETGTDSRHLTLEITESTLFQDPQRVQPVLDKLKALGVHIALDDFGTGQSSLSHLRNFPIDIVKIDREFVQDIPDNQNDCELVAAIIAMAHNLNMCVVAEGVETEAQLAFLHQHGCDSVQGYLFSRPLPRDELFAFLTAGTQLKATSNS